MEQDDGGYNWLFYIYLTVSAVFGFINIRRAFNKPDEELNLRELERLLRDKDKIIESLESRIEQYQKLVENGTTRSGNKLE